MHTPGPWATEPATLYAHELRQPRYALRVYATDPGPDRDYTIAFVRDVDPPTRETHARLIAAAPELLEALQMVLKAADFNSDPPLDSYGKKAYAAARAAIAKAQS